MKKGKLENDLLTQLLVGRTGAARDEVLQGAGIGKDCAVLDFGSEICVLSTDPITAAPEILGTLAVHVACNDIAAHGVHPLAILLTILLPEQTEEAELREILRQANAAAKELDVQIAGGHTEITDAVTRPLLSTTAIGRAAKSRNGVTGDIRPGDRLFVTKTLALEGTCILAERREKELGNVLTDAELARAKAMISQISVVREGILAGEIGVSAMHDITEGGILGAVWETCLRGGVGAEIEMRALPFDDITLTACAYFGLDPMRLISSGSMLIVCPAEKTAALEKAMAEAGVPLYGIGAVTEISAGIILRDRKGGPLSIDPPGPDEIYKAV
ncbi:MAG: AIR synthase family protein [Clostridiales bacterium]|nr:AIR synthase family protein [Clostridiales bacterium]